MAFRVIVYDSATADLDEAFAYVAQRAPHTAAQWLNRFQEEIEALSVNASIYPPAAEVKRTSLPLRQALYGKKPYAFRVIFFVQGNSVHVLRAVRGQRRSLTRKEIHDALNTKPPDEPDPASN